MMVSQVKNENKQLLLTRRSQRVPHIVLVLKLRKMSYNKKIMIIIKILLLLLLLLLIIIIIIIIITTTTILGCVEPRILGHLLSCPGEKPQRIFEDLQGSLKIVKDLQKIFNCN